MNSAISSVTCYTASPVETCDRCSAGIKYVSLVRYKDGTSERYGSECINKILDGDTSLKSLYNKNVKLLKRYRESLDVLRRPYNEMPRGSEYYGSGLYFIAGFDGKDLMGDGCWIFHPIYDEEKNSSGQHYVVTDPAARLARCEADMNKAMSFYIAEIERIEKFLARILNKAKTSQTA